MLPSASSGQAGQAGQAVIFLWFFLVGESKVLTSILLRFPLRQGYGRQESYEGQRKV